MDAEVVVVGAGLAGLACARALSRAGRSVLVIEGSDGVGGRVRTDEVDGFLLDRGFQVLLTAYPELEIQLDLEALAPCPFEPGASVFTGERFARLADPVRAPRAALAGALAPVGTLGDKARLFRHLAELRRSEPRDLLRRPDSTVAELLDRLGFSDRLVERFFRPLLGGITLDPDLGSSAQMAEVVLRCLAVGRSVVPARGMGELPAQLAAALPREAIRLGEPVLSVGPGAVTTAGGTVRADRVVVATDGPTAAALVGLPDPGSRPVSCYWFEAPSPPVGEPIIVLDGAGTGPVWNVAELSAVAPGYAPAGRVLVAAACPGRADATMEEAVRRQLAGWWGPVVERWSLLRVDSIAHGQPAGAPPLRPKRPQSLGDGLFVCGDHRDTPSIQGALFSGRRCGEHVAASLR